MAKLPVILLGILLVAIIPFAFAEYDNTIVLIETNSGNLAIEFFHDDAPLHVEKFVNLSQGCLLYTSSEPTRPY